MSSQNFESTSKRNFSNSYFYRAHLSWNKLPLVIREIVCPGEFKVELLKYLWEECIAVECEQNSDSDEDEYAYYDDMIDCG